MTATSAAWREPDCKIVDVKVPPTVLKSIRNYFEQNLGAQGAPLGARHSIELATAALLVEVVRSDARIVPKEQQAVLRAVREKFGLSADESQTLFDLAEEEVRTANDYYQFTSLINRHFDQPQKQHIIELMWRGVCRRLAGGARESCAAPHRRTTARDAR